jgi:predicted TIM-barrel fold metal-dependent hydrolase
MVGDHPYRFMDVKFDKTNPPGSMHELLRKKSVSPDITWGDSYSADNMVAAFQQRDERLGLMEEQGIETAILLPTFGASVEQTMVGDVDQTYANLRAFNCWLNEEWGFARDGRIIAPPLLSLLDVDRAVIELDRVLSLGARLIHVRPGPTGSGRSPADPYYDPFWARLNEARVPVAFHINDYRYPEVSRAWGEDPDPPVREMSRSASRMVRTGSTTCSLFSTRRRGWADTGLGSVVVLPGARATPSEPTAMCRRSPRTTWTP